MGSTFSRSCHDQITHQNHRHHHQGSRQDPKLQLQILQLEQQVGDLERQVQKEKELRVFYRSSLDETQDYLKHCLHIAQENGFLKLIINPDDTQPCLHHLPEPVVSDNPSLDRFSTPPEHSNALALVSGLAKANGWWIEDPLEVEIMEKIAQGSTADIYKAAWRGLDVAVKCISPEFFHSNPRGTSFFAQELETLARQRHRFVLQLMGACIFPPNHAWIVTELLSTTLNDWLHGPGKERRSRVRTIPLPPLQERLAKAVEISQAMQYLHEQNPVLIHRDLKPTNIFLDDTMHVRVADFGHARFIAPEESALTGEIGTYVYMAPEVIRCEPYNEKCDVYSFGVILNELVTGDHPFIERSDYGPPKIAMEVAEGKLRPQLAVDKDGQFGELRDLICLAWDPNPSSRPPFSKLTFSLRSFYRRLVKDQLG